MANSMDPDQTAPIGAVCSGSTLFALILNLSVMSGNYLQQTTFSDAFFLGVLRFNLFIASNDFLSSVDNLSKAFDTLIMFLKEIFEKVNFKKVCRQQQKHGKLLNLIFFIFFGLWFNLPVNRFGHVKMLN